MYHGEKKIAPEGRASPFSFSKQEEAICPGMIENYKKSSKNPEDVKIHLSAGMTGGNF